MNRIDFARPGEHLGPAEARLRADLEVCSPFLRKPLRDIEQVCLDRAAIRREPPYACARCALVTLCRPKVWHGEAGLPARHPRHLRIVRT